MDKKNPVSVSKPMRDFDQPAVTGKPMYELDNEIEFSSIAACDFAPFDPDLHGHVPDYWDDARTRGTWNDVYTARRRVFPDGQCEVTVCKEKFFVGAANVVVKRAKRGESEHRESNDDDAGRRAKKTVRQCCKQIRADRLVTLTYRENMVDRATALKHWKAFCRKLGKHKQFHYVAVIEEQERGALHFHIAVSGRQMYALLRSIWQAVLGLGPDGEQMGQVNVRDPHRFGFGVTGAHKIASYIAKYCGKEMQCRALDQKRYFRSRGIVLPEVLSWRLKGVTTLSGAVSAAFEAIGRHRLEGLESWCNNGLGIVYLATAPGYSEPIDYCPF